MPIAKCQMQNEPGKIGSATAHPDFAVCIEHSAVCISSPRTLRTLGHCASFLAVISLFAVSLGCEDGRPKRVPVSGIVTIDGQPLTAGSIRLTPEDGRVARGSINSQGRFTLSTFEPSDGCPLGTHAVAVRSFDVIDDFTVRWNIPKRYLSGGNAGLTATIDGPTDDLRIELSWAGSGKQGPFIERTRE